MLTSLLLLTISVVSSKDQCLAVSMSGGGACGAYEAGVLWGLYHNAKDKDQYRYDVLSGVSAGSINSAMITQFAVGEEDEMLDFLAYNWPRFNASFFFQNWTGGFIEGITIERGMYNTTGFVDFFIQLFKEKGGPKRAMNVASVDLNGGKYQIFTDKSPYISKACPGSGSIPFGAPPVLVGPYQLADGGGLYNQDLVAAIHRCREMVDNDTKITIDVI